MSNTAVPTYSFEERDRRWGLARALMEREGLDALLVFGEHEDAGPAPFAFDTWFTNDRPGGTVLLLRIGAPRLLVWGPTAVADHNESLRRGDALWIPTENICIARDANGLADVLNEHGLASGTIGVVGAEPYRPFLPEGVVPYRLWSEILAQFPDAEFKLVGVALARLMIPLSDEELAVVRYSASVGDEMARAMVAAATPGIPESEVFAAGMAAAHLRGTVVPWMHLWSGPDSLGAGPPPWAYRPQSPRVLQDGDMINAEVFCNFGMRSTQHQVTIAIGEIREEVRHAEAIARASYDAGLTMVRPGITFEELVKEMRKPVEEAGGELGAPLVHLLNPFGAVGGGAPTTNAALELERGMTFAFEPRFHRDRCKVTIGGTVIVGDHGPIELNPYTAHVLRACSTP